MRGIMSPAAAAKKRLGGGGGFALGCGCKDTKAVAVAAPSSSASPYTTDLASTATWRTVRASAAHPSASSGSTGTLTVPSASSSSIPFTWEEDAEEAADSGDAEEEEVNCGGKRESKTASFSGLLRQLNELEQSVVSLGPKSTGKQSCSPPPTLPPPLPSRPVAEAKQRASLRNGDSHDDSTKEGHGDFSPPQPPPPPSVQFQTQQHRKPKSMVDKGDGKEGAVLSRQPPPHQSLTLQQPAEKKSPNTKTTADKGSKKKEGVNNSFPQQQPQQQPQQTEAAKKHRKAKSLDVDGTVAVVKQSADPLGDFRRSMVSMIVENGIATGDELRELLRHFLALNAPHHHDAILRAFTEIWDEAFSTAAKQNHHNAQRREPSAARRPTPPRQRTSSPQRRRQPARVWR